MWSCKQVVMKIDKPKLFQQKFCLRSTKTAADAQMWQRVSLLDVPAQTNQVFSYLDLQQQLHAAPVLCWGSLKPITDRSDHRDRKRLVHQVMEPWWMLQQSHAAPLRAAVGRPHMELHAALHSNGLNRNQQEPSSSNLITFNHYTLRYTANGIYGKTLAPVSYYCH